MTCEHARRCGDCFSAEYVARLENELAAAYAELRKQVFGSRVVFDRDLVERAKRAATVPTPGGPGVND